MSRAKVRVIWSAIVLAAALPLFSATLRAQDDAPPPPQDGGQPDAGKPAKLMCDTCVTVKFSFS